MLHTINTSSQISTIKSCIDLVDNQSSILFIEDGVLALTKAKILQVDLLHKLSMQKQIFALSEDVYARGIVDILAKEVVLVDYKGFVDLCIKHPKIISWY